MVKKAAEAKPNHLLRAARIERNWTQKEVADRIGAPQSFNVSRWEQGTAFPSAHYVQQLCLLFEKSARELGLLLEEPTGSNKPSPEAVSSPVWAVPFRRNPFFTGREKVLTQLHNKLAFTQTAALTQTQAISGLGGIGKTQIAVEYTYRYRQEYRAVLWVRAASRDTLISDYVALAALLHLPEENEQDQNMVVAAVKRWLAHYQGWLLVLDNADDLELIADFLPTGDNGHILITSRAQATGSVASSIAVEKMGKDEGARLLLHRAKLLALDTPLEQLSEQERSQAEAIVEAMDGLPLALDQAGAYIEETGSGLVGYLELYHTHRKELLHRRGTLRADHPEPVASTWALSFFKVERANPAAADLLRLCAFLDPDAIPEEIITEGASLLGPVLGSVAADPLQLNEAIQVLRRYSLIKRDAEAKLLNIHRLVQAVLKDGMEEQMQRAWAERAVRMVNAVFPGEVTQEVAIWPQCQRYLSQTRACTELVDQYGLISPEAANLLDCTACYLRERGLYQQAEPLFQRALTIREHVLGPEHPETADNLNNLAHLYDQQGRYVEAESFYQRALTIRERVLGPEHPETADNLNNLALLYDAQGRHSEAEFLYRRALDIYEAVFGPEHLYTAIALNNLANLHDHQGRYDQAEPLYQRTLTIVERELGPEHPFIATTLSNLALLYDHQGRYDEAELPYQRALHLQEHLLGLEHPNTAITLNNLAGLYFEQGKYGEAEPFYQQAFRNLEQALGPEHHLIASALNGLANLYTAQGKYGEAESLYQRALRIREQALGLEHHLVATALKGLANLYTVQGEYEQAEPVYQRALRIREKALGLEHPDTVAVREHYIKLQQKMKETTAAVKPGDAE